FLRFALVIKSSGQTDNLAFGIPEWDVMKKRHPALGLQILPSRDTGPAHERERDRCDEEDTHKARWPSAPRLPQCHFRIHSEPQNNATPRWIKPRRRIQRRLSGLRARQTGSLRAKTAKKKGQALRRQLQALCKKPLRYDRAEAFRQRLQ